MTALIARDAIFSELHRNVLKPLGFRKKGHWSILNEGPISRTVYLRASRWSSKTNAPFWIDIQVFHSDYYSLIFGPKAFPGPSEGTPSLVTEHLNEMLVPEAHTLQTNEATDDAELAQALCAGFTTCAWPLLQKCASLEGILSYYQSRNSDSDLVPAAAICVLLNRIEEAQRIFKVAKKSALHEQHLRWIESRESAIWANSGRG